MEKEISIYHKPGKFLYTVWDSDGEPLYVGGTENIMAKSFKFDFPFADITGIYWEFPGYTFEEAIDLRIAELRPKYNTRLRTSLTAPQVIKCVKEFFKTKNLPFTPQAKRFVLNELENFNGIKFDGELYYSADEKATLLEIIREEYGIRDFNA